MNPKHSLQKHPLPKQSLQKHPLQRVATSQGGGAHVNAIAARLFEENRDSVALRRACELAGGGRVQEAAGVLVRACTGNATLARALVHAADARGIQVWAGPVVSRGEAQQRAIMQLIRE